MIAMHLERRGAQWRALPRHRARLAPAALLQLVRQVVAEGRSLWIGARGPSMSPTIRDGDQVLLVAAGAVRRGDVVLADIGGCGVLHRVVRTDGSFVWTVGDGVLRADAPLPASAVIARAIARERGGRITALAMERALGVAPLARGLWWELRLGLARRVRRARTRVPEVER